MKEWLCLAVLFLASGAAYSCQCTTATVEEGMANSAMVFVAVVTGARVKGWNLEVEISDFSSIKGSGRPLRRLTTPVGSGSCGFVISVPEKYIFFTDEKGSFSSCGATRLLHDPSLGVLRDRVILQWRKNIPRK